MVAALILLACLLLTSLAVVRERVIGTLEQLRGGLFDLLLASVLYVMSDVGLGLLISTSAKT